MPLINVHADAWGKARGRKFGLHLHLLNALCMRADEYGYTCCRHGKNGTTLDLASIIK